MYACVTCGLQLGVCPTLQIRVSNENKKEGALYVGGGVRGGAAALMLFLVLGPLPPSPRSNCGVEVDVALSGVIGKVQIITCDFERASYTADAQAKVMALAVCVYCVLPVSTLQFHLAVPEVFLCSSQLPLSWL